eukprot:GHVS01103261.1.p1 GENE.GHVS01103261.1~~GHVS01103261.1.p1  ORF type:complete len:395 (+),score=47.24 GHVS01103261.1:180-1364(+)
MSQTPGASASSGRVKRSRAHEKISGKGGAVNAEEKGGEGGNVFEVKHGEKGDSSGTVGEDSEASVAVPVGSRSSPEEPGWSDEKANKEDRASSAVAPPAVCSLRNTGPAERMQMKQAAAEVAMANPYMQLSPQLFPMTNLELAVTSITEAEYPDDFTWSPVITAEFYSSLLHAGFIPLATTVDTADQARPHVRKTRYILLPKLHVDRCVMDLDKVHVSKKTKKRSKGFTVTIDTASSEVVDACVRQHAENWLVPPLQSEFRRMFDKHFSVDGVKLHSFEIWKDGKLAAGEIGSTVGSCYCSLTGFYDVDSAGTIQLCVLGSLLRQLGFTMWDLGMSMDYKLSLGATVIPRATFVQRFRKARLKDPITFTVNGGDGPVDCTIILKKECAEAAVLS